MKSILLTALAVCIPVAAHAQDGEKSMLCHHAVAHTPLSDVAYQPGVDVDGNAVTPADADTGDQNIIKTTTIQIPLTVDLAQWLGITAPAGTRMETVIGLIEMNEKGDVLFNGKNLNDRLATLCAPQNPPPSLAK